MSERKSDAEGAGDEIRSERVSIRRDPRADPDDEPVSAPRVDVFNERSLDSVANAALTLRRELAKLHQQAAAVERTLEDQKRERAEWIERLEAANAKADEAEEKLRVAEAEATRSDEEGTRLRAELERFREAETAAQAEIASLRAELAEVRKREEAGTEKATANESELQGIRERLDHANAELSQAKSAANDVSAEAARLRDELKAANDAFANEKADAERQLASAREEIARLDKALTEARAFEERRERELEATTAAATAANARATAAERARLLVEDSVKQLRDEITSAFARWRAVSPSLPPSPLGDAALRAPLAPASSIPSPGIASVPPEAADAPSASEIEQATASAAVSTSILPDSLLEEVEEKEQAAPPAPPPAPRAPPRPRSSVAPRSSAPPMGVGSLFSVPPTTGSAWPSEPPPTSSPIASEERDALLVQLADAENAHDAAIKLLLRPEWLRGRAPLELLVALTQIERRTDSPVFELARAWEREPLCKAIADFVTSESEPAARRCLLVEAIEVLVTARSFGWSDVGELLTRFARQNDTSLRRAAVAAIAALERSDDKRRALLEYVRADESEDVIASVVEALAGVLPIELDPDVAERLLGHPSERVQASVAELIEKSKSARG